ncbi:MAG: hypothetical protein QHC90_08800 [Shinella sp.]|nr:hypothetical protein [Shinella sp.]
MADDCVKTISGRFATRAAADLAVEHLVQQYGLARPDIFLQAGGGRNTAGTKPSGGDASHDHGARPDAALRGEIEVSADIREDEMEKVAQAFRQAGAQDVRTI